MCRKYERLCRTLRPLLSLGEGRFAVQMGHHPFAQSSVNRMLVLGIETSCDETGLAVYDTEHGLLAHALHSQAEMHQAYGGVVPELASRDHIRRVVPLTERVLAQEGRELPDIDGVAYTQGP